MESVNRSGEEKPPKLEKPQNDGCQIGEHSQSGAKYVWEYPLDYFGVENTLAAEGL